MDVGLVCSGRVRRGAAIALIYYKAGVLAAPSAAGPLPPSLCWPCLPSFFHLSLLVTFLLVAALATITFGHDDQSLHSFLNDGDDLEGIEMALASSPPIPHPSSHDRHRSQRGSRSTSSSSTAPTLTPTSPRARIRALFCGPTQFCNFYHRR
jgi:hypothetical protein